jgi:hypothetical protein
MPEEPPQPDTAPDVAEVGARLFADMDEHFIAPEVTRRRETGEWSADDRVWRFQVLMPPDGENEVRLNEQVSGTVEAVATRALEQGEDVMLEDISGVKGYEPRPEDAGVPHVTAFAHRDGWSIAFEFSYRHPRRFEYLELAGGFAATAHEALAAGRLGVALDNAYSAVELLAKAELLSCHPTIDDALVANSHGGVATPYSLWARLDNTEAGFVRLLYRLQELRPAGRYLNKQLALNDGEPDDLFKQLSEMEAHVRRVVDGQETVRGDGPHGFNVIAAREVRAGQLVTRDDYTLRPPKPPKGQ